LTSIRGKDYLPYARGSVDADLTSLDMGENCNREWKRRLGILEKVGWFR
jgi:hypothetical protein